MTALENALDILAVRHAAIVAAYALTNEPGQLEAIAGEALEKLGIDPAGLTLDGGIPKDWPVVVTYHTK